MNSEERAAEAARLYNERWTCEAIAEMLGCSPETVQEDLKRLGVEPPKPKVAKAVARDQRLAGRFLGGRYWQQGLDQPPWLLNR